MFYTRSSEEVQLERERCTRLSEDPSLSKNGENSCLCVLFELVCLVFPKLGELYSCVCVVRA